MSAFSKLLESSPFVEVAVRNVFWRTPMLSRIRDRVVSFRNARRKTAPAPEPATSIRRILPILEAWGLRRGDLVVLHSAYRALRAEKDSPDAIVDVLLDYLGPEGTLAAPAIPLFENAPKVEERLTANLDDLVCRYDPATTPTWTGAIPAAMMKRPGAFRSRHPFNSLVAIGAKAEAMMRGNLDGDRPFPCGPQSAWAYCYHNGAKILALGADMAHSLTMIHLAEDLKGEAWPVRDWYRERKFEILIDGAWQPHVVRERRPSWALFYGERTLSKDLVREGITMKTEVDGVNVEALEGKRMVDYLDSRNRSLYPYFLIPRRHHRTLG